MVKKVIIIGAGISGLAVGTYLQMNGYNTEIFELHSLPGGLCTAWKRKEYLFDGCIHWLVGSSPKNDFYPIWQELNAFEGIKFIDADEYYSVVDGDDKFTLFYDDEKLRSEMLRFAPEDHVAIDSFISEINQFSKMYMPFEKPVELFGFKDKLFLMIKHGKELISMSKYSSLTYGSYLQKFQNRKLRKFLQTAFPSPNINAFAALITIGWQKSKQAGYPIGGSLPFARNLERSYYKQGGKITYNSRVTKIITEKNQAMGIVLASGETYRADIVISAADGYNTIYELLGSKYTSKDINGYYKNLEIYGPICQISFGINFRFDRTISSQIFYHPKSPIRIDPKTEATRAEIRIYNFDSSLAPDGKTVVTVVINATDFEYWQKLRKENKMNYIKEKERIGKIALGMIEELFPEVISKLEVTDVATPATYYRFTNNWRGSYEGWINTPKINNQMKNTLPGLSSFYFVNQWVNPGGGIPTAALAGRNVAQIICHKDKKPFMIKK